MNISFNFLNVLFRSSSCVFCNSFVRDSLICNVCKEKIYFVYEPFCIKCQNPSFEGSTHYRCSTKYSPKNLITPFVYSGIVRDCVIRAKYKKQFSLVEDLIDYLLVFKEQFNLNSLNDFTVTSIPSDKKRFAERGFNLPTIIGQRLAQKLNLPFLEILVKQKQTPSLTQLKKDERKRVVKGCFAVKNKNVPKNILLVDDILTTGSTMLEATKILKKVGAFEITCFTLAYRPLKYIE